MNENAKAPDVIRIVRFVIFHHFWACKKWSSCVIFIKIWYFINR